MFNEISDNLPAYLFHQGTNFETYDYLGVHIDYEHNTIVFRVWAPNAEKIFLVGDFNDWQTTHKMYRITQHGIWEISLDYNDSLENTKYKYRIEANGTFHLKSDPYALYSETLKNTASIIYDISNINSYKWNDKNWNEHRKNTIRADEHSIYATPINIYEMHLGSWRTRDGKSTKDGTAYLNYREIADQLAPYVKQMGYTHIELLPVAEHPFDGSWGYQICGYYAPTSRFGTPEDFMYFVDKLHSVGIGVILDWVPAHFPKDECGLYEFDGGPLYEYQGIDRKEHAGWGTRFFDVGRTEIQSFLISNALFWFKKYHIDGLRIDAVASMLYLDYDRTPGEWIPNHDGSNHNLEAIAFFKKLNSTIFAHNSDVLMIAEESTSWPMITKPVDKGGLGFNFKWNMGWSNDIFDYVNVDPFFRKHYHGKLTFSLVYAFSENYVLPVSHDEVVHGKRSLIDKMYGTYEQKFAGFRVLLSFMMSHPGKKLLFMGSEFGQFREWDYENQLEWFMLDFDMHKKLQYFTSELNHFYLDNPTLWEVDNSWGGFKWISADNRELNTIAFERKNKENTMIIILNFSSAVVENYCVHVEENGLYKIIFNSDSEKFGGNSIVENDVLQSENYELNLTIPPLSALFLTLAKDNTLYVNM